MFDSLSTRLQDVFRTLRGQGRLTEDLVEAALREIRLALLEADVNFKVVKAFIDRVRDRASEGCGRRSAEPGLRRGDRRHCGPAAHRRRADGRARRDSGGYGSFGSPVRR